MFTNPDHDDDIALSAEEKLAFSQLTASVTPDEIDPLNGEPCTHPLGRGVDHLNIRRFANRHLGAFGSWVAGVGFALAVAAMAVSLVVAVAGLVLMVLGLWCLIRLVERPHQARGRAVAWIRKMVGLLVRVDAPA